MAAATWPLPDIQAWGRWQSEAVLIYVQDAAFQRTWGAVADSIVGHAVHKAVDFKGSDTQRPDESEWAPLQGRVPIRGDMVSYYAAGQSRWLKAEICLTPKESRPPELSGLVPIWPIGATVFVAKFTDITKTATVVQPITLDDTTRWVYVGEPKKKRNVRTRTGRVAGASI